jgi:hypothetical protein
MAILQKDSGSHFDPLLISLFSDLAESAYANIGHAGEGELISQLREQAMNHFFAASIKQNAV